MAGSFTSNQQLSLEALVFPEFSRHRTLEQAQARIFEAECRYDIIFGRDVLSRLGLVLDFNAKVMTWDESSVLMRPFRSHERENPETTTAMQLLCDAFDDDLNEESSIDGDQHQDLNAADGEVYTSENDNLGYKSKTIKASTYEKADVKALARSCSHLSLSQQADLEKLLSKYEKLFDGKLKVYKGEQVHLDLKEDAVPARCARAYTVPHQHLDVFKVELDRLVEIGVLEPCGRADWIAGTFIIPKKDGKVRWISDFRGLNQALKRRVYPLPRINDILNRRSGYKFFTKMDISMQYYTFELDDASKDLCTIATPFGLFRYRRLPMGVSQSPDVAQEMMENLLRDLMQELEVYIDDIAAFSNTWHDHLIILDKVLTRLQDAGFTVNPLKCEWGVKETDFLGYWLTPTGLKPWKKKIDAILKMEPPTNLKQLRSFLGLVTYYRDMWPRRSHILAPLTDMSGGKFEWTPECTKAFEKMKAVLASDACLAYPDHNLPFDVETDASDYQLGACIKQKGRPVAYYTRKLNSAQRNYSTIEKELLSIVETLREFRTMLLGAAIRVHTDHKNLTHKMSSFSTQRVIRWRLLLEEYSPTFVYKRGDSNFIADALSRVPTSRTERESATHLFDPFVVSQGSSTFADVVDDPNDLDLFCSVTIDDDEMTECLLQLPFVLPNTAQDAMPVDDRREPGRNKCPHDVQIPKRSAGYEAMGSAARCAEDGNCLNENIKRARCAEDDNCLNENTTRARCAEDDNCLSMTASGRKEPYNDSFLEYPSFDEKGRHPFHFETIRQYQQQSSTVQQLIVDFPSRFVSQRLGNTDLICARNGSDFRIVISDEMLPNLFDGIMRRLFMPKAWIDSKRVSNDISTIPKFVTRFVKSFGLVTLVRR